MPGIDRNFGLQQIPMPSVQRCYGNSAPDFLQKYRLCARLRPWCHTSSGKLRSGCSSAEPAELARSILQINYKSSQIMVLYGSYRPFGSFFLFGAKSPSDSSPQYLAYSSSPNVVLRMMSARTVSSFMTPKCTS